MRRNSLAFVCAISLLLVAGTAGATDHHISTSGNDNNNGLTTTTAWRTFAHATWNVSPGDTVYVHGGTYYEWVAIWNLYGTSTQPIKFVEATGETAIIDGTNVSNVNNGLVEIGESTYVTFEGFEVRNSPASGILIWESQNITVKKNVVHGTYSSGIGAGGYDIGVNQNITVDDNEVYDTVRMNVNRDADEWQQALTLMFTNAGTITNNRVHENYGEGIDYIASTNGVIRGNTAWDNFATNLYLDNVVDVLVEKNHFYTTDNSAFYRDGSRGVGIQAANEMWYLSEAMNGIIIRNNIIRRVSAGFYYDGTFGGGIHDTQIANNTIYDTSTVAFWIDEIWDPVSTITVVNNIFVPLNGNPYTWVPSAGITWTTNAWYDGTSWGNQDATVTTNPNFASAGGTTAASYYLQSTSPCKTAGTTLSYVTDDYWGTSRTSSYSIGAHEY